MPPRASWKGFLNLSLVSIPVKAYTSSDSGGQIRLNQLHAECHSRIRQKTVCPKCDAEVSRSDIVKGYEYAKDQYVVIDLEELEKLRSEDEGKSIKIDSFVPPEAIDPVYFTDTNYYLIPDGAAGQKSYTLLRNTMAHENIYAIANIVLYNKEQLVLVRPVENLICMTMLKYTTQVKAPSLFDDEISDGEISDAEYKLAKTLVDQVTVEDFDLSDYHDKYTERLTELIEAKVEGKEIVSAPSIEETPAIVNLMDALKASISSAAPLKERARKPAASGTIKKVAKKSAKKTAAKKKAASKESLAEALEGKPPAKKKTARKKRTG